MSAGVWFVLLVGGGAALGVSARSCGAIFAGVMAGFALWCLGGLWWVVSTSYDCTDYYDEHGTYAGAPKDC